MKRYTSFLKLLLGSAYLVAVCVLGWMNPLQAVRELRFQRHLMLGDDDLASHLAKRIFRARFSPRARGHARSVAEVFGWR